MAILTVQSATPATFANASAGGDSFPNDGTPLLLVQSANARTLTVASPHAGLPDYTLAIGAGTSVICPRFDPLRWNDPATGYLAFAFDSVVGVAVAVVRPSVIGFDPTLPLPPSLM